MENPAVITEKTHPIEQKWVIKSIIGFVCAGILSFLIWLAEYHRFVSKGGLSHSGSVSSDLVFGIIISFVLLFALPIYIILAKRNYRYEFGQKQIVLRQGIISKSERISQYGRIQNICIEQSLINRLLGLASVSIETASEGAGAKFMASNNKKNQIFSAVPLGFFSNKIGIPGLSYKNAIDLKNNLAELIKKNPIDDAESGL